MKKIKWGVALLLICFLFCSCGNTNNNNPAAEGAAQPATETASPGEEQKTADSSAEASDTVSANGYTVKIVAVHKTADSNGEPIAAMEFLFTNENAEPVSFMSVAQVTAFQNGIELHKDEMFLERDYNWDSFYTEIKDGATISVFHAIPLQNEEDPVEIAVNLMDMSSYQKVASTTIKLELTSSEPVPEKDDSKEASSKTEVKEEQGSDTVSSGGVTIKIVAVHKTKDSNGDPMAAAEFLFTNDNAEPISFMSAAQVTAFQNGIELHKDEMFLERDYDWDSFYTEIKDGATISVFRALPLQNEEDPVDIKVDLLDTENWVVSASTTFSIDLED